MPIFSKLDISFPGLCLFRQGFVTGQNGLASCGFSVGVSGMLFFLGNKCPQVVTLEFYLEIHVIFDCV